MKDTERVQLRDMITTHGVHEVMVAVGDECFLQADHVRLGWGAPINEGNKIGKIWESLGRQVCGGLQRNIKTDSLYVIGLF